MPLSIVTIQPGRLILIYLFNPLSIEIITYSLYEAVIRLEMLYG